MIRHVAELSALLLCFAVGVSLLAAFGIGLLLIWGKRPAEDSTLEDEYRRVLSEAFELGEWNKPFEPLEWMDLWFPRCASRPYNWATREPMVWQVPRV